MESHRCPSCNALVTDRRSPLCTTCHAALPADWIMTPQQATDVEAGDLAAKAEHLSAMRQLDAIRTESEIPPDEL
jgi:hypothetical protein